ncbi:alpha/beta hydrolase family protein [Microbispora siamensis]
MTGALGPAVRTARGSTVQTLADPAHTLTRHPHLNAVTAYLPTSLLLGVRLLARRHGRAVLASAGTAATTVMVTALLTFHAELDAAPASKRFGPIEVRTDQTGQVLLAVTLALVALSTLNTVLLSWGTAVQARRALTITRTLGATPGQVVAAHCVTQLLPPPRVAAAVREPGFAAAHRLDPDRLALAGHSFGAFAALTTAAADPGVSAVASVSAFDFGSVAVACRDDAALRAAYVEGFGEDLLPLKGTSGAALVDEMIAAGEAWSLSALAPKLADRPVLLVGTAGRDTVTPAAEHHDPVVAAYTAYPVPRLEHRVFVTDHALSDHRLELAETVRDFLDRHLGR